MKYTFSSAKSADKLDATIAQLRVTSEKESYVVVEKGKIVLSLGASDKKQITRRRVVLLARQAIALAKSNRKKILAITPADFTFARLRQSAEELGELIAASFEMANYEFVKYKTRPKEGWNMVQEVVVYGAWDSAFKKGIEKGNIIGEGVNMARSLSNTPAGEMTPRLLAKAAREVAGVERVKVKVLGREEMKRLKMGGVLGVAQGSSEEPQFIIVEYKGGGANERPLVLMGKGITFDSGGINLKPEQSMADMHMDMSGGAAVIAAVATCAKLKTKKNVVGLVPAAENMPSGSSYRPGDVIKTMSGKTVEILSTDAEGRVVMADAFTYAKRYNPRCMVDAGTFTGAAVVALGNRASALFGNDEKLVSKVRELGEESGDYVWPFPLWSEYEEDVKGTFGDLNNTGKSRYGGAITCALFLKQFVEERCPWVHVDTAPRMTSVEGEFLAKGAAGAPVRLLIKMIERL